MVNKRKAVCGKKIQQKAEKGEFALKSESLVAVSNDSPKSDDVKMTSGMTVGDKSKRVRDEESEGVLIQSSGRISKKPKWDYDPYSPPKKSGHGRRSRQKNCPETLPRGKKPLHLWTSPEKDLFFEAVKEHGRDWKALFKKFHKHKISGTMEKNPETIRQFYYRSWHKIAKYLTFPEGIDRQVVELFGLVCYGEIRKKTGHYGIDSVIGKNLNELVYTGKTTIKYKKPGSRKICQLIRTPRCAILEKLNNFEGLKQGQKRLPLRLPREIVVELRPRSNAAWAKVQAISHNPRIRTKANPSRRLSSFIDFMNKKWKSLRLKMKEGMRATEAPDQELMLFVPESCSLDPFHISNEKNAMLNHSLSEGLCLKSFIKTVESMGSPTLPKYSRRNVQKPVETKEVKLEESTDQAINIKVELAKVNVDSAKSKDNNLSVLCSGQQRQRTFSKSTDGDSIPLLSPFGLLTCLNDGSTKESSTNESLGIRLGNDLSSSPESVKLKLADLRSAVANASADKEHVSVDKTYPDLQEESAESIQRKIESVRSGLNIKAAEEITVNDLYLMMNMPEKVVLEYDWIDIVSKKDILNLGDLANMLRRLVDIAKVENLEFGSKTKGSQHDECLCSCGASKISTPPNAKRNARRGGKMGTPKDVKRPRDPLGDDEASLGSISSPTAMKGQGDDLQTHPLSSFSSRESVWEPHYENPFLYESPFWHEYPIPYNGAYGFGDGLFKVPVSAAPRCSTQDDTSINVNNIAQRLSPKALLEQMNQANRHRDIFLPPRRQRRKGLRRPMVVQRRLLPKPLLPGVTVYSQSGAPQGYVTNSTTGMKTSSSFPEGVIKIMTPADIQSVTVKSVVGPGQHLNPGIVTKGVESYAAKEKYSQSSSQAAVSSHADSAGLHFQTATTNSSGLVPVASLESYIALQNLSANSTMSARSTSITVCATQSEAASTSNLISQAALAARITAELNVDKHNEGYSDGSGLCGGRSVSPLNTSLSALLDISLPSVSEDTADKMLDLTMTGSSSSLHLSGLLDSAKNESLQREGTNMELNASFIQMPQISSPTRLSPSKIFSSHPDEPWLGGDDFNLSSFLAESPAKCQSTTTSASLTTDGAISVVSTSGVRTLPFSAASLHPAILPLLNESSRDSVISKTFDLSAVDGTLQSMMNENSLDLMSKFADLAREISGSHVDDRSKTVSS